MKNVCSAASPLQDGTRVSLLVDQRLNAQGVPAENGTLKVPDAREPMVGRTTR